MVVNPHGVSFAVDVKGLYKKNFWAIKAKMERTGLFYVFVFVPDEEANRLFILTQAEVNAEIAADFERARARALVKGRSAEKVEVFSGVTWKFAESYENKWKEVLPA